MRIYLLEVTNSALSHTPTSTYWWTAVLLRQYAMVQHTTVLLYKPLSWIHLSTRIVQLNLSTITSARKRTSSNGRLPPNIYTQLIRIKWLQIIVFFLGNQTPIGKGSNSPNLSKVSVIEIWQDHQLLWEFNGQSRPPVMKEGLIKY